MRSHSLKKFEMPRPKFLQWFNVEKRVYVWGNCFSLKAVLFKKEARGDSDTLLQECFVYVLAVCFCRKLKSTPVSRLCFVRADRISGWLHFVQSPRSMTLHVSSCIYCGEECEVRCTLSSSLFDYRYISFLYDITKIWDEDWQIEPSLVSSVAGMKRGGSASMNGVQSGHTWRHVTGTFSILLA